MARKTKAQLTAEREALLAEQFELAKAEYPARSVHHLEEFLKEAA